MTERNHDIEDAIDWASRHGYTGARRAAEAYAATVPGLHYQPQDSDSMSGFGIRFCDCSGACGVLGARDS